MNAWSNELGAWNSINNVTVQVIQDRPHSTGRIINESVQQLWAGLRYNIAPYHPSSISTST